MSGSLARTRPAPFRGDKVSPVSINCERNSKFLSNASLQPVIPLWEYRWNFSEADFWKVSGIPLVRLKLHREVAEAVKLAVQKQE
jgi:hypothetical protein